MMKRLFVAFMIGVLLISIVMNPVTVNADTIIENEAIDKFVTSYIRRNGLPGASIVIVKDGKLVYEKGYGYDSEGNPLTEKSLMRIGSVSKSFTGFSVLQLVDKGKINLDDPVVKHLPELRLDDRRLQKITIRHLLSHTSEMKEYKGDY